MRKFRRFFGLFLSVFLLTIIIFVCVSFHRKVLILNTTDSMPHGYYYITRSDHLKRGDIVCFPVPATVETLVKQRQWLPPGGIFLKRVVGMPGDHVCIDDTGFTLESSYPSASCAGTVLEKDSLGRSLPHQDFCGVLSDNTYFAAIPEEDRSFDSRYFGPIHKSEIIGVATPLWIF